MIEIVGTLRCEKASAMLKIAACDEEKKAQL